MLQWKENGRIRHRSDGAVTARRGQMRRFSPAYVHAGESLKAYYRNCSENCNYVPAGRRASRDKPSPPRALSFTRNSPDLYGVIRN